MSGELSGARGVALVIRFLLELALLAGAAVASLLFVPDPWRWGVAVVAPVAIAVVWGILLSPRRRVDIGGAGRVVVEALLFAGVGAALALGGGTAPAIVGVAVWLLDRVALAVLPERGTTRADAVDAERDTTGAQ